MQKMRGWDEAEVARTVPEMNLCYSGLTVGVDVPTGADAQWLREFFCPWFAESDGVPDARVRFRVDTERFNDLLLRGDSGYLGSAFMMDTRVIEYPRWVAPDDATLLLDRERELFFHVDGDAIDIVAARDDRRSRLRVMRVIRELAMDAAHAAGGRFLHASCVAVDGRAIAVTGPRSAGKTSLLLYLLCAGRCDYLTNDRLLVRPQGDRLSLEGMPTVVSIRAGTLGMFEQFAATVAERRYSTRLTIDECEDDEPAGGVGQGEPKQGISPAQLCAATGATAAVGATGSVVLIPHQSGCADGFALRRLSMEEARAALAGGLFGHIGPGFRSDVFRYRGTRVAPVTDEAFIGTLSAGCRVYECRLGTDAYDSDACAGAVRELLEA
jgi:hypothetical protein